MVLQLARKLAATVLGQDPHDPKAVQELKQAGHEEFSKRFDVDMETEMRGSVKPYHWVREVTDEHDSLAKYLSSAEDRHSGGVRKKGAPPSPSSEKKEKKPHDEKPADTTTTSTSPTGVYSYKPSGRLSIVNGSHHTISDDPDTQATVLVLPDYVAVTNVPISSAGASALWEHALDPAVPRAGTWITPGSEEMKTWTLPYNCLIMLCSHKRRDARCHIAAERLHEHFARSLESEGWHVDTDLEDLSSAGPPLESIAPTEEARQAAAIEQLRTLASEDAERANNGEQNQETRPASDQNRTNSTSAQKQRKALILKNSHIGGHKFAGNVIPILHPTQPKLNILPYITVKHTKFPPKHQT
ncbi:hypothetical protein A7U60_g1200 [Sanghuangporus baumii]|uniref:Uncharacterized protein n=1 Tax=Sanghuangporus baumii TaxID=108892 RepID=A0A9Q5I4X6_SANBA|nr:hypothetical protein A7U60_g1200 [Sanghuangporus baumii]